MNRLGTNQLKNVNPNWLIRGKVELEIDDKVLNISKQMLLQGIKWDSSDPKDTLEFSEFVLEFIDVSEFTYEEFHYLIYWVSYYCRQIVQSVSKK